MTYGCDYKVSAGNGRGSTSILFVAALLIFLHQRAILLYQDFPVKRVQHLRWQCIVGIYPSVQYFALVHVSGFGLP